jgi:hypothetical protein
VRGCGGLELEVLSTGWRGCGCAGVWLCVVVCGYVWLCVVLWFVGCVGWCHSQGYFCVICGPPFRAVARNPNIGAVFPSDANPSSLLSRNPRFVVSFFFFCGWCFFRSLRSWVRARDTAGDLHLLLACLSPWWLAGRAVPQLLACPQFCSDPNSFRPLPLGTDTPPHT